MKKSHLDHILRAAKDCTGETKFVIVGSQSLHGKGIDVDALLASQEVDLYMPGKEHETELLNAIGEGSRFHETFGYYADPVGELTAVLPKGWKGRLVNLPPGDTNGAQGLCLDPHDMAVSKYVAGRDKDLELLQGLIRQGELDQQTLLGRLAQTSADERIMSLAKARITRHFASVHSTKKRRR
jgi:hypothetical protein